MKKLLVTLLIFIPFRQLHAQNGMFSKQETDSLITEYCRVLNETYFNKALGKEITATLQKKLEAGDFYNVTQLTDRLSLLLRNITKDVHFYIGVNSPVATQPAAGRETDDRNGGFSEVRMLDDSIGYIKWNDFIADKRSFKKAVAALQFLHGCRYLIFDLSGCPGGDGRAGGFMNAHLFKDDDYQQVLRKRCGGESKWHRSEVPYNHAKGPKLYDVPIFVIVSGHTASAAEYFALTMKETKRGIVLGDTTAGAGNPSTIVTFGNYFACIPICEIETRSGKSIEGKGVIPDVNLVSDDWLQETLGYIQNRR